MSSFLDPSRRLRQRGVIGIGWFMVAFMIVGASVFLLIPPKEGAITRNERLKLFGCCLAGAALFGLIPVAYHGISVSLSLEGLSYRRAFPAKDFHIPWPEMARVDFFVQQRRMGLNLSPSSIGVKFGKIIGLRIWKRNGSPFNLTPYLDSRTDKGLVLKIFEQFVRPAIQKAANEGRASTAVFRVGRAASEFPFSGELLEHNKDVVDLVIDGESISAVCQNGDRRTIHLGDTGGDTLTSGADLRLMELAWDRPMQVGGNRST